MKTLTYNKTIIIFLNINDMTSLRNGELKEIKKEYLKTYDNCIIYNYFDLKEHKNVIRDKINKLKHTNQTKINARKCIIKHIDNNTKNKFLNENHIQGTDKSQIFYGAYHVNELIAVLTFDNKMSVNGGTIENEYNLSRFSTKSNNIIVGIFNKMLKNFIKDYSPKIITSYADLNFVNKDNNIYQKNHFKLNKIIQSDYKIYLLNKDELYHKFTFGTKYFKNEKISDEDKNITKKNIVKVWNCGKLKYEIYIDANKNIVYGFIYQIENKINNKKYIGQTTRNLTKRIWEYKSAYNLNKLYNDYLLNSFNKYGWDNFEFTIIDTAENLIELNEKEIKYIEKYNTLNRKFGYNIEFGGNNSIPATETLEKMSKSHLGIIQNSGWIEKRISKAGTLEAKKYGKVKTDDEKSNLSINSPKYWEGKSRDETTKKKISDTKKLNGFSDLQKDVICKKVLKINQLNNEIVNTYNSTAMASKFEGVNQSTISRWCSNNKTVKGFQWKYA